MSESFSSPTDFAVTPAVINGLKGSLRLRRAMRCHYLAGCAAMLMAASQAQALELGEANVRSTLGSPLHVEVPYRLAGNERLTEACVSLVGSTTGLPTISQARIGVSRGVISIRHPAVVREPLVGLDVRIACQSAPHIVRSYHLFIDPPSLTDSAPHVAVAPIARQQPATISNPGRSALPPRARGAAGPSVQTQTTYVVQPGDTLSGIAARIDNRTVGLWDAVAQIHASNPQAFTNGNIDLLEAGATLTIPALGQTPARTSFADSTISPATAPAIAAVETSLSAEEFAQAVSALSVPSARSESASPDTVVERSEQAAAELALAASASSSSAVETTESNEAETAFDVTSPFVVRDDVTPIVPSTAESVVSEAPARTTPGWVSGLIAIGSALVLTLLMVLFFRRRKPSNMPDFIEAPLPAAGNQAPRARVADEEDTIEEPALPAWEGEETDAFPSRVEVSEYTDSVSSINEESDSFSLDVSTNKEALDMAFESANAATPVDLDVGSQPPSTTSASETGVTLTQRSTSDSDITIAELDLLTKDYEAELTATQQLNQELADAVASLKATDANGTAKQPIVEEDEFDDAETAFLEEVEVPDELRWDDKTRENAHLMTEELLEDATFTVATEIEGDTVEMPRDRDSVDERIVEDDHGLDTTRSQKLPNPDDDDEEWEAFTRAANANNRS